MSDAAALYPGGRADGPVFISYTHQDGFEIATFIETYLRAGGIIPWRDLRDLPPGVIETKVREAIAAGLSAGILVVTLGIGQRRFVPDIELPALLEVEEKDPKSFSFHIVNTIRDKEGLGGLDPAAPDNLVSKIKVPPRPLRDMKQYALLRQEDGQEAATDMDMLLSDLLKRRLAARHHRCADREVEISVQTRPVPNQMDAKQSSGRTADLTIRLEQDKISNIPTELSFRCLQLTLPRIIDSIFDARVEKVVFQGGCHSSLAWALGAALPDPRPRVKHFVWRDTYDTDWSSSDLTSPTSHLRIDPIDIASLKQNLLSRIDQTPATRA